MSDFGRQDAGNRAPAGSDAMARLAVRESQVWATAQGELLAGTGALWADCIKRRGEAIDAATRSLQQLWECRSIGEMAQVHQRWLAEAFQRTIDDFGRLTTDAAALSRRVAGIAVESAGATSGATATPSMRSRRTEEPTAPPQRAAAE